ncbi:MAG: TonB-dependent receptor [Runella slithyformis]|nr:MAG: TonB-dependent receptor [Runella slithyformis]
MNISTAHSGMPAWTTLNLRASYEVSKNCTIQAACENLTDQNYRYFASGISAPGRNLVLTLRGRI